MVIDARGMLCPWPAVRLARAMRECHGGVIEVLATDPKAAGELAEVARAAGRVISGEDGRFLISQPHP